jgi:hypothetical protein
MCKKNTNDLYCFGLKNALRPVRERSLVLSCTEVLVVGVTTGREREELLGLKTRGVSVFMSRVGVLVCSCPKMVPAFPFYRCKRSTGLQVCAM